MAAIANCFVIAALKHFMYLIFRCSASSRADGNPGNSHLG
jgi:hypothetical protein